MQRDLQRMVRDIGFHSMPLNDDSLRVFLDFLWDFSRAHDQRIWAFELTGEEGRIFHGFQGDLVPLKALHTQLDRELQEKFTPNGLKLARPTFSIGKVSLIYFGGIWTPAAALAGRRH